MLLTGAALALAALTAFAMLSRNERGAHAQSFTVDTTADAVDASPGDGTCATAGGGCSLRAAVQEANALAGADSISIPAGTYTLSLAGLQEDAAATGDLDISTNLTIQGAGSDATIIDGAQVDRVFDVVEFAATVSISNLTMRNGRSQPDDGGAVHNRGILTLSNVQMEGNHGDDGGALVNYGTTTILGSSLRSNSADDTGGAISNLETMTIRNSSIEMNSGPYGGGGVNNFGTATISESLIAQNTSNSGNGAGLANFANATLVNVTVSGNSAAQNGGGISSESSLALANVTNTDNTATHGTGGGLFTNESATQFRNSIIAGNQPDQCAGTGGYISQGNNISSAEGCLFTAAGDLQNTDPMLRPLADNGGPTQTHALLAGSPAIDAGSSACPPPDRDQRGIARPLDGDGNGIAACDIGAFEVGTELAPTATPTRPPPRSPTPTPFDTDVEVGDANCDGRIDSIDAAIVLQRVAGLLSPDQVSNFVFCRPDVNQDGHIDSIDAALILQYSAGLLAHLPP